MTLFDRDDLDFGLRQLVARLRSSGARSGLRIIGGAALALRYFDRESTVDIDAHPVGDAEQVLAAGRDVARENGWPHDWLTIRPRASSPSTERRPSTGRPSTTTVRWSSKSPQPKRCSL
jgi:hypothetical protein